MAQRQKAPQGMWFYKDEEREGKKVRVFTDLVALGCNDVEYSLCTDAEKQEWVNNHKEDYPEIFETQLIENCLSEKNEIAVEDI